MNRRGPAAFRVRTADWEADGPALRQIRHEVFVAEQRVPEELEWDGLDAGCLHAIAESVDGTAVGTGRLLPDGHIGRMAVRAPWRGQGIGTALLGHLIAEARARGQRHLALHAQTHALGFYARHGFVPRGPEYLEAGIPHRTMVLELGDREDG